jgi:hypothetical protein
MRGIAKGEVTRIVLLAHQVEAMARQKVLKAPDYYLNPKRRRTRVGTAAVIAASMKQLEQRGMNVRVRPHVPKEATE